MGHRRTAVACAVACWSLLPAAAWAQSQSQTDDNSFDARLARLQRTIERQQKIIEALEERVGDLELVRVRGRGVGGNGPSAASTSNGSAGAAGAVASVAATQSTGQPSGALLSQADGAAAPASESTTPGRADPNEKPRIQSKDLVFQAEHAPLFERRFTLDTGFSYSYYDRRNLALSGFLALDAIFLGQINLVQTKANVTTFDVTGRYGFTDRLSADFTVPAVYRSSTFFSGGAGGASSTVSEADKSSAGLGDVSAGIYYQLVKESVDWPDIVGSFRVRAPTGRSPFGIKLIQADSNNNNLIIDQQLPTGNGVWSGTLGVSFLKTYDPVVLFANASYTYFVPRSFADISSTVGVVQPGKVKLGDTITVGGGLALALNDRTALTMAYSTAYSGNTHITPDGGAEQSVVGSKTNVGTMTFGISHVLTKNLSISATLAMGLTPDAPNYVFSLRFPYTW
ncbi:transporter [Ralstonia flaminis]|jgi:hypothetical protein|uniref:Transporter n=1 Tax=Ralstonia flaminis TaxID=3058597 RepID=A0ABN9JSD3_9RALS|nr:transporter [Ralstonia sp. LMG 18101]CAJ0822718.1 hypothetical protein LMG18101_05148 [Ralstonia sp. LMG 18101]